MSPCHRIDNLVVPPVVEEGEDQVVLECPFTFTQEEEREDQLELKWYFNDLGCISGPFRSFRRF